VKSWPRITFRVFGVLHIIIGVLGIGWDVWMYLALAPRQLAPDPRYPYALHFYCLYVCVDLLCLVFLIRAGVALWRLQPRGRWLSNLVLVFEVVWSLIQWEIFLHSPLVGKPSMVVNSMQVAYGVSTAGAEIQILTV
jgi:hypothetical protein